MHDEKEYGWGSTKRRREMRTLLHSPKSFGRDARFRTLQLEFIQRADADRRLWDGCACRNKKSVQPTDRRAD